MADVVKAGQRRERKAAVLAEDFVRIWQTSESYREAAERMGMGLTAMKKRADTYRKLGVQLKKMPVAGPKKIDVGALNALIESLASSAMGARAEEGKKETASPGQEQANPIPSEDSLGGRKIEPKLSETQLLLERAAKLVAEKCP